MRKREVQDDLRLWARAPGSVDLASFEMHKVAKGAALGRSLGTPRRGTAGLRGGPLDARVEASRGPLDIFTKVWNRLLAVCLEPRKDVRVELEVWGSSVDRCHVWSPGECSRIGNSNTCHKDPMTSFILSADVCAQSRAGAAASPRRELEPAPCPQGAEFGWWGQP